MLQAKLHVVLGNYIANQHHPKMFDMTTGGSFQQTSTKKKKKKRIYFNKAVFNIKYDVLRVCPAEGTTSPTKYW